MTDLAYIDPLLYGYFSDDTLEHGERVGLLPETNFETNTVVQVTHRQTDSGFLMRIL